MIRTRLITGLVILALHLGSAVSAQADMHSRPHLRLDHMVVWVDDMEESSKFFTDILGWKRHPLEFGVTADDPTTGGMEGAFFDANGFWLELILPTSPGPGMDILNEKGAGAIIEINFEPADYDATLADMEAKGITMENMDGTPISSNGGTIKEGVGKGDEIDNEKGQRIAYWPKEVAGGTTVEIFERGEDETSLINVRDAMWKDQKPDPNSPFIDHISIFVKDLEKSAKFYTDVMGLKRHPMKTVIDGDANQVVGGMEVAFIDAGDVWLELVQPTGPGPVMDLLNEKGDGYVAEMIIEVDDMDKFYDEMKAKGIELLNIDGKPFENNEKSYTLKPFGIKAAYFPTDVTHGLSVEAYQRGPRETSLLHKRDANWKH